MTKHIALFIATFFYSGFFPFAPGTAGTLATLPFYYFFLSKIEWYWYLAVLVILYLAGTWASSIASGVFKKKDPGKVVIDETAGYLITMFMIPFSVKAMVIGFFVARILDIIKPPPARQAEALPSGNGIMADDAIAGVYGNIIMWGLVWAKIIQ